MAWASDETTQDALDANGGGVTGLSLQSISGAAPSFEPDEGFLGRYWGQATEPAIENTCVDGGADSVYIFQYDVTAAAPTTTINLTAELFLIWFLYTAKTGEILQDSDGIRIRCADSGETVAATALDNNYIEYKLTGAVNGGIPAADDPNGVLTFYEDNLIGGWNSFAVGGENRGVQVGTGCDLTDVRWVGVLLRHQAANTGNDPSFAFDWIRFQSKFTVTGGTTSVPETLDGLRTFDRGVPADRGNNPDYGTEFGSGIFYEPRCAVDVGNGTTATVLAVEDAFWNLNPFAEEVPYDVTVTNNAELRFGRLDVQAQASYPVGGVTFAGVDEVYISSLSFENGSEGNLYGSRLFRLNNLLLGEAAAGTDPTIDLQACDVDTVRRVEFRSTNADIVDTDFHDPLPTFLDAAAAFSDDAGVRTAVTTNWNNTATATTIFPATEAVGDSHIFGFAEQFGAVEFEISTSGVAGVVVWEYWNGTSWSLLANVQDDTDSFTANVSEGDFNRYRVTWNIPSDWAVQTINTVQAFYIRARITTVYTTNPQIQQGRIGQRRVGQLFDEPNTFTGNRFFKCDRALYVSGTTQRTLTNYEATDNAYDLVIDNNADIVLVDSLFDSDKILQI